MGVRMPFPILPAPAQERVDAEERRYRNALREVRHVAYLAEEGLISHEQATRDAAVIAMRELGEIRR